VSGRAEPVGPSLPAVVGGWRAAGEGSAPGTAYECGVSCYPNVGMTPVLSAFEKAHTFTDNGGYRSALVPPAWEQREAESELRFLVTRCKILSSSR
jgi:hypothetical protein